MSANKGHNHHQIFDVSINLPPQIGSKCFDDDGRLKRTDFESKMSANKGHNHHQIFDVSINLPPQIGSKCFDDDGRLKRTDFESKMSANKGHNHHQIFDVSINLPPQIGSKCFDDDGRLKRTGTVWTASAHIITAVIGSGVLSLAWATAQLGWIAGPTQRSEYMKMQMKCFATCTWIFWIAAGSWASTTGAKTEFEEEPDNSGSGHYN
ncbi:Transmembrane amino acid transporter domain-containing protein [Forsythia ovata]|uniref:Transmembrane amino acid transporter domain-containing protein n=1 Tax=Forsythia ovata TaxID=205694 RepID=A0ABD1WW06_9LAMI